MMTAHEGCKLVQLSFAAHDASQKCCSSCTVPSLLDADRTHKCRSGKLTLSMMSRADQNVLHWRIRTRREGRATCQEHAKGTSISRCVPSATCPSQIAPRLPREESSALCMLLGQNKNKSRILVNCGELLQLSSSWAKYKCRVRVCGLWQAAAFRSCLSFLSLSMPSDLHTTTGIPLDSPKQQLTCFSVSRGQADREDLMEGNWERPTSLRLLPSSAAWAWARRRAFMRQLAPPSPTTAAAGFPGCFPGAATSPLISGFSSRAYTHGPELQNNFCCWLKAWS